MEGMTHCWRKGYINEGNGTSMEGMTHERREGYTNEGRGTPMKRGVHQGGYIMNMHGYI